MATVSELCEIISKAVPMPLDEVKKYARALINSGDLPKALGRSIPRTDMYQRARLILAIAASERPADCVKAMRDRYEARARFHETESTAGEVLAEQMMELARGDVQAFQKWSYSLVEVSRGGVPRVQFRINEMMKHYDEFHGTAQPEFLGGPWLSDDADEMALKNIEFQRVGMPVSAFISGGVLMAAAFETEEKARAAHRAASKAAWKNLEGGHNDEVESGPGD